MSNWYGEEFNPVNPLDWLAGVGYVADTPYSMVRNALAGEDVTKGLVNPQERTTGRQLLEHWGLVSENEDGLDAGDVAGFGVEMLDPLSMATGLYAPKMLKAAKLASAAKKASRAKTLATMGMEETPKIAEFASKLRASEKAAPVMSKSRSLVPTFSEVAEAGVEQVAEKPNELPKVIPLPGWKYAEKPFYSRLEKAATDLPDNVKAASLRNMLAKSSEGVSKEEMDWVLKGLPEKGVLSKDEVLQHVKDNGIKVDIKQRGASASKAKDLDDLSRASSYGVPYSELSTEERSIVDEAYNTHMNKDGTKWDKYSVPGGDDYKEILVKLPRKPTKNELYDQASNIRHDLRNDVAPRGMHEEMRNRAAELEQQAENITGPQNYKSAHWDEPNVLAHARFDTRDLNGEKTLFVNEIQSDWHQAGRRYGYAGSLEQKLRLAEKTSPRGIVSFQVLDSRGSVVASGLDRETAEAYVNAHPGAVPDAPFKGDEWAKLTLKHLLDYASKNGYDRIALANGSLAAKFSAGGAKGKTASSLAKWYDETLPNMLAKLLKKDKVRMEPAPIFDRANIDFHHPMAEMEPAKYIVPTFHIPQSAKKRILQYGQPLLSLVPPIAAGYGLSQQEQ